MGQALIPTTETMLEFIQRELANYPCLASPLSKATYLQPLTDMQTWRAGHVASVRKTTPSKACITGPAVSRAMPPLGLVLLSRSGLPLACHAERHRPPGQGVSCPNVALTAQI
jgi:hypothetical protein